MKDELVTFRKFSTLEDAGDLLKFLKQNKIPCFVENDSYVYDASFANNQLDAVVLVKIPSSYFELADEILLKQSEIKLEDLPADHYLFEFTDEELYEILLKSDEWSPMDYNLAVQLLTQRGNNVSEAFLATLKKERNKTLAKQESYPSLWITLGYALAMLGGVIGFFIGYHLMTHKKVLPNGQKIYAFSQSDRTHGKFIVALAIVFGVVWILIRIDFDM